MTLLPAAVALGQTPLATHTDLTVSTAENTGRTAATFKARVVPAYPGSPTPGGSVSFLRGAQSLGSAFLDADGNATLTVAALPAGTQNITAAYQGDSAHQPSASSPATVHAEASGAAAFTLSANPTSLKVAAGSAVSTLITATPENGFNQAVSLSCSGVPYVSVSCIFSPAQVTPAAPTASAPNGTPALSTLTIQTIAPSGAELRRPGKPNGRETAYALLAPGFLALAGLGLVRRRVFGRFQLRAGRLLGFALLLLAGTLGLGGCNTLYSYQHHGPGYNPGTPAGSYTLTVTGITGIGSSLSTATVQIALDVTN